LLDLEPVLRDALVLALPLAPLCRQDCPGLCAECGALLAQAGPEHGHERAIDPRWARLRQEMTQEEQVGRPAPEIREESGRGRPLAEDVAALRAAHQRRGGGFPLRPQCRDPKLPHTACPTCGTYNRRQVITPS